MSAASPRMSDNVRGRGGSARWRDQKTVVWGAIERKGQVRATVVPHLGGLVLRGQLRKFVLPASTVFTDDAHAYGTLAREG